MAQAEGGSVIIVDDQATSRAILAEVVAGTGRDVSIETFGNPLEAINWLTRNAADLILVDVEMPEMSGIEFIRRVRGLIHLQQVPIITVSAHIGLSNRIAALEAGATDFLAKPVNMTECGLRCRNLLDVHRKHVAVESHSRALSAAVREATEDVRDRERETLMRLAKAGEYRDEDTGNHILRMARYSGLLARACGMSEQYVDLIEQAAPLHDIGKIAIPDNILLKPGKLDEHEWVRMKQHATIGHELLAGSRSKYVNMGAEIAFSHHEKFDGSGYPHGIRGDLIPLAGRIVAIADVYDALTSERPYKKPWPSEWAFKHLVDKAGSHFDPMLVDYFELIRDDVCKIQDAFRG